MKSLLKYFFIFCITILSFNILLLCVSIFPSNWIKDNVEESAKILKREGNKYDFLPALCMGNNNYTDAIIINAAYSIDNENPFYSYMVARKNFKKGITQKELMDTQGELVSLKANKLDEFTEKYDPVRRIV